ncbi:MAG: hypothetical protein JF606_23405 [Burkholderiales bacterium]|jgi:hypothetical protein|nr:hypothetical protein [Burkholderiales bacterium]
MLETTESVGELQHDIESRHLAKVHVQQQIGAVALRERDGLASAWGSCRRQ